MRLLGYSGWLLGPLLGYPVGCYGVAMWLLGYSGWLLRPLLLVSGVVPRVLLGSC